MVLLYLIQKGFKMLKKIKQLFSKKEFPIIIDKKLLTYLVYYKNNKVVMSESPNMVDDGTHRKDYDEVRVSCTAVHETCYTVEKDGKWKEMITFTSTWSEDLVLALYNDKSMNLNLQECIRLVASLCEKCLNVLTYYYNLPNGYSADSKEAKKCGTSCNFCKGK